MTQDDIDRIRNLADLIGLDNAGRIEIADAIRELAHAQRVHNALELNKLAIDAHSTAAEYDSHVRSLHLAVDDLFPTEQKDTSE